MLRITSTFKKTGFHPYSFPVPETNGKLISGSFLIARNTKLIAWAIFLIFFIEAGTLGLLPSSMYFVYRNVRLSDIIMYAAILYSLLNVKEYIDLFNSKVLLIVKILLIYMIFQFIISVIEYKFNVVEYFFRLKQLWMSMLVFPFMLLLKRGGLGYLAKLIFPVAVISNIFYILSAITGVAILPDTAIVSQNLPGGLKVWRVYGGTFYGDFLMLGLIFYWSEYKFKLYHMPFFILFALPHVLAFGRNAWVFFSFSIILIIVWSSIRKRDFRTLTRQIVMIAVTLTVFMYFFNQFIPQSEELSEAIEARIQQGQEDVKYGEGTYGTRMTNLKVLIDLWLDNPIFGIGMHPLWVIKPVTNQENIIAWGLADVRWAGVLAVYGTIGFLIAVIFQISYIILSIRLLKKIKVADMNYFFLLMFFITLLHTTLISYSYILTCVSTSALGIIVAFYVANIVYLYEKHSEKKAERLER